jgi:hypothetical protein
MSAAPAIEESRVMRFRAAVPMINGIRRQR